MAVNKETTIRRPIHPDIIGETLNYLLTTRDEYKELTDIDQSQAGNTSKVDEVIKDVFSRYFKLDLGSDGRGAVWTELSTSFLREGDIITLSQKNPESKYVVTFAQQEDFTTWPRLISRDELVLKGYGVKKYKVIRPKLDSISNDALAEIESIAREVLSDSPLPAPDDLSFKVADVEELSDGFLQIGDIGFLVDPTQISLTTRNGYQIFPTMRTQGNPKIPTIDQIKDISITLIFPNRDSINFQLLNLIAMIKRTPFVNIRNKDICSFFSDITVGGSFWPNRWVSVGLESLYIQSIEGFPDTLQAQITMLPFDSRVVTPGFQALKSMEDVSIQQAVRYNNKDANEIIRVTESKLNEQSVNPDKFREVIQKAVRKSYDFRESLPFRAFYQSMIHNRNVITDEYGEPVKVTGKNLNSKDEYPIGKFRPTDLKNRLYHYDTDENNKPIRFNYKYIEGDPHEVNKLVAEERQQEQNKLLERLNQTKSSLQTKDDLLREVVTSFHTIKDAYSEIYNRFNKSNKIVPKLLGDVGITLDSEAVVEGKAPPIESLWNLIIRGIFQKVGVEQSWNFIRDGREFIEGKFQPDSVDPLGLLKGLTYYGTDQGLDNEGAITTAQGYVNQIYEWLSPESTTLSEERKSRFSAFLINVRRELLSEYVFLEEEGNRKLSVLYDITSSGPSPFRIARIPLKDETIEIDNYIDVVTGFSIVFSNKFVPISIQAFKYPYYQHIGSEDPVIGMSIKSTENSNLRNELSLLSERLYQSNKIIMLNAPELLPYVDGRLQIETSINHVLRAFGVHKAVFTNSNTTSDPNNPKCWNTNISLTQANFTIEDYHKIEHVPTNNRIKREIAKLLARIEIVKRDENDRGEFIVKSYKQKTISESIFPLKDDTSKDKNPQSSPSRAQIEEISDMDLLMRLRFVFSRHGETFSNYLERLNKAKSTQARRRYRRKTAFDRAVTNIANAHYESAYVPTDPYVAPVYEEPLPAGSDILEELTYLESNTAQYDQKMQQLFNKQFLITRDDEATKALNELITTYPMFEKILRYVLNKFDKILEKESKVLMNQFQLDRGFLEILFGLDNDLKRSVDSPTGPGILGSAALSALSFAKKGIFGDISGVIFSTAALLKTADTFVQSFLEKQKSDVVEKFDQFFLNIIDSFNLGALQELANKIYRDPVIRDKFIDSGIITPSQAEEIREATSNLIVNCYNDFDIPVLANAGYFLSPDFYLYNNQLDRSEADTFVVESLRREARIGKLTAMMTLEEQYDTVNAFDNLLQQVSNVDNEILRETTSILLDGEIAEDIKSARTGVSKKREYLIRAITKLSRAVKDINDGSFSESRFSDLVNAYEETYPKTDNESQKEFEERFENFKSNLILARGDVDIDQRKLNLIYSARMSTLFKIFERYVALTLYMERELGTDKSNFISSLSENPDFSDKARNFLSIIRGNKAEHITKKGSDLKATKDIYSVLNTVLKKAQNITTDEIETNSEFKPLKDAFVKGLPSPSDEKYLTLPSIRNLQISLFNDISFYVRLNTFLRDNESNTSTPINFDSIPELKMLEFWNFRARDANVRRVELTKEFIESYKSTQDTSSKMFPTFKLYFIEEDTGVWRSSADYYSHNAIQSIEIVSSKESAGKTAVIRLSNVTNTLTNKLSFHREADDVLNLDGTSKDAFFGTLDVKPGTAVMIKMGYAPNDKFLDTLFVGRIIEMNAGPIVEMVCQSYGSQLNYHIVSEHFGLLSTRVREYGDVASALLDSIPGLEKLGKLPLFGIFGGDFSGKNLRNIKGKPGDRFLLGNLLGSVSALSFAQDNPRDENIYLPYSLIPERFHHPTFDWLVYEQSVWESLRELSLYMRNVEPTVRLFNDDPFSFKNEVRETLVMGDKSGYYKYTDTLGLSMINYKEIDRAREIWNKLRTVVSEIISIPNLNKAENLYNKLFIPKVIQDESNARNAPYVLAPKYHELWLHLQNNTGALLLIVHILEQLSGVSEVSLSPGSFVEQLIESNDFLSQDKELTDTVNGLLTFSKISNISREEISSNKIGVRFDTNLAEKANVPFYLRDDLEWSLDEPAKQFIRFIRGLSKLVDKYPDINFLDIPEESYYNIKTQVQNTDESLASDPRYKKIQTHHLITDTRDIISNNIALNSQFANAVNVFYTGEPSTKNVALSDVREAVANKSINIWEVKAFGNVKDEHLRVLNSYQKNIDTNFWDIAKSTNRFFDGYNRVKFKNNDVSSEVLKEFAESSSNKLGVPRWDLFPSFVLVGVRLLQREVEKMYQGTIEIVGDSKIKPYDIIHLQDYTNDMHGAVEVQEVVHSFTPEGGFRTIITPNIVTYDRDPVQLQDIQVINNISDFANDRRRQDVALSAAALGLAGLGAVGGGWGLVLSSPVWGPILYNSSVGGLNRYYKFMYDQLGNILGRDCINFTSLIYHGEPFMAGFDGVDYTNLKTLINQKVEGIGNPITRFAAFTDPLYSYITTNDNVESVNVFGALKNEFLPFAKSFGTYPGNSRLGGGPISLR